MSRVRRVVIDTSILVSAALRADSLPHRALLKALGLCEVCASTETLDELERVMNRKKFDRYLDRESRRSFVMLIRRYVQMFDVQHADFVAFQRRGRAACRDPKDAKFLALALAIGADAIVSGDDDLLVLNPWLGIRIMTAAEFLDH